MNEKDIILVDVGNKYTKISNIFLRNIQYIETSKLIEFLKKTDNNTVIIACSVVTKIKNYIKENFNRSYWLDYSSLNSIMNLSELSEIGDDLLSVLYFYKEEKNLNIILSGTMSVTLKIRNYNNYQFVIFPGFNTMIESVNNSADLINIKSNELKNLPLKENHENKTNKIVIESILKILNLYYESVGDSDTKTIISIYNKNIIKNKDRFVFVDNIVLQGLKKYYYNILRYEIKK